MVDYSMGGATMSVLPPGDLCATIEIKISYLASVRGGTLAGEVTVPGTCAGFSIVGDATYALAANASQQFIVRYAPTDALLKTLLFANVEKRIELHQFLEKLYRRYGLVFGDKDAERVLAKDEFDKKAFQANSRRLEQRLASVGLLRRVSDGCAYVVNPYRLAAQ